jgi:hypothetical protein
MMQALGSKPEKMRVLRGFLMCNEFCSRDGHPLEFQQPVVLITVTASLALMLPLTAPQPSPR